METLNQRIAVAKFEAWRLNQVGDYQGVAFWIEELDRIWTDDRAAMAFYTQLEQESIALEEAKEKLKQAGRL